MTITLTDNGNSPEKNPIPILDREKKTRFANWQIIAICFCAAKESTFFPSTCKIWWLIWIENRRQMSAILIWNTVVLCKDVTQTWLEISCSCNIIFFKYFWIVAWRPLTIICCYLSHLIFEQVLFVESNKSLALSNFLLSSTVLWLAAFFSLMSLVNITALSRNRHTLFIKTFINFTRVPESW